MVFGAVVVVVFCDGGEKYLSERFWDESADERRASHGGAQPVAPKRASAEAD